LRWWQKTGLLIGLLLGITLAGGESVWAQPSPYHNCTGRFSVSCLNPKVAKILEAMNGQECSGNVNCKICTIGIGRPGAVTRWDCGPWQEGSTTFKENYNNGIRCLGGSATTLGLPLNPPSPWPTSFNRSGTVGYLSQTVPGATEFLVTAFGRLCVEGALDDIVAVADICNKSAADTQNAVRKSVQAWRPADVGKWVRNVSGYLCNPIGLGLARLGGMAAQAMAVVNGDISIKTYLSGMTACWLCPLFEVVFNSSFTYAKTMFDVVAGGLRNLIGVALAVWLLLQAAKLLMPFGPEEEGKTISNSIVSRIALTVVVVLSLSHLDAVFDYVYTPIMTFLVDYSGGLQETVASKFINTLSPNLMPSSTANGCPMTISGQRQLQGLSGSMVENPSVASKAISCQLQRIQEAVGVLPMMGFEAFMSAGNLFTDDTTARLGVVGTIADAATKFGGAQIWHILINIDVIVGGLVIMFLFGLLLLLIPVYMIDSVFQMAVIMMISPFLVATAIYPKTRAATVKGIKTAAHAMMTLLLLGIIAAFVIMMMNYALEAVVKGSPGFQTAGFDIHDSSKLIDFVDDTKGKKAVQDLMRVTKPFFWLLAAVAFLGILMAGKAYAIAGYFIGGAGLPALGFSKTAGGLTKAGALYLGRNTLNTGRKAIIHQKDATDPSGRQTRHLGGILGAPMQAGWNRLEAMARQARTT
jgi:hypothetical protein